MNGNEQLSDGAPSFMMNEDDDSLGCDLGDTIKSIPSQESIVEAIPESIAIGESQEEIESQSLLGLPNNRCLYVSELQDSIDDACKILYKPWKTAILMDMCLIYQTKTVFLSQIDMMQYASKDFTIKDRFEHDGSLVYFDINKYPVTEEGFDGLPYKNLSRDICNAAIKSGFYLVKNGFKDRQGLYAQEFTCNRYQLYKGDLNKKKEATTVYRGCSYNDNNKLSRGTIGLKMPRMTSTMKPISKENKCKFSFYLTYDNVGFFLVPGGTCEHSHHPRLNQEQINFPSRLLSDESKDLLQDMNEINASSGVSMNLLKLRTGKYLSKGKIRWISGLCSNLKNIKELHGNLNSTEKMIKYLEKNNLDYMILLHDHEKGKVLNQVKTKDVCTHVVNLPSSEKVSCLNFANNTRRVLNVENNQSLLMGIAWVNQKEVNLFSLFPEVIFCDVISDVNKDQRPLLTCTGKDSNGKMYTFLRAFLPNEKQWVFRWIFSNVFPNFFPKSLLSRVNVIISDGCVQEFSQIDDALNISFLNAKRVRCGFHIVRMGWSTQVIGKRCINPKYQIFYETVCVHLKSWIYSWMRSTCESEIEYKISKLMFFRFIHTSDIVNKLGKPFVDSVETFVRSRVEPHEKHYCYYLRKKKRHFDEVTNSLHEGTNKAIRHSGAGIGPSTNIENSLIVLNQNGMKNIETKAIKNVRNLHGVKLYAKLTCSNSLVPMGYSILEKSWSRRNEYVSIRISFTQWNVLHRKFVKQQESSGIPVENAINNEVGKTWKDKNGKPLLPIKTDLAIIPNFMHIRMVEKAGGILKCSCCFYERFGIACAHMYNICQQLDGYNEPSHHEVSVRWWSSYALYGSSNNTSNTLNEKNLLRTYASLRLNENVGIPIHKYSLEKIPIIPKTDIPDYFIQKPFPVCLNFPFLRVYPKDVVNGISNVGGLSQVISNLPENCFDNAFDFMSNNASAKSSDEKSNPYSELMPYFKEMTSHMEGYCVDNDYSVIKNFFQGQVAKFKAIANQCINCDKEGEKKHEIVSSSIPTSKKRKAHGTKHY